MATRTRTREERISPVVGDLPDERGSKRGRGTGRARWPWAVLGVALFLLKSYGLGSAVLRHPFEWAIFLGIFSLIALTRTHPVLSAFYGGVAIALGVGLHPVLLGIASAVVFPLVLLTLFVAIGTVLNARARRRELHGRRGVTLAAG